MTEETQQSSETTVASQQADQNASNLSSDSAKSKETKKEKCRPMTKVVIRRLPPSMTEEQFMEQVSPLPENVYVFFVKADMSLGQYAFSRAYIDFVDPDDIFQFREKFDNYVFVDAKGTEYPAVVEYAPFQRFPKNRVGKKKDLKCGTIESDPYYISFLESLKTQEADPANAQPKTEYSFQPSDHAPKRITTTPLLDFLKQRKQEKQRLRDEKREEKRRRDLERKRNKDEPLISKVLKNIEDRDRDVSKENKENKEDKEKNFQKDLKNRNKKDEKYRDKIVRERDVKVPIKPFRDDRVKERDIKQNKKHEEKKVYNKKDDQRDTQLKEDRTFDKEEIISKEKKMEEKRGKSYEKMRQEKKRLAESQKKQSVEPPLDGCTESQENTEDNEDEDYEDTCISGKDSVEKIDDESNFNQKNKKTVETITDSGICTAEQLSEMCRLDQKVADQIMQDKDLQNVTGSSIDNLQILNSTAICERLGQSASEAEDKDGEPKSPAKSRLTKRRSSLESGGESGSGTKVGGGGGSGGSAAGSGDDDSSCLRRHKSLDGGNDGTLRKAEGDEKDKDKKDPRLERRIRNKDRPTMEIYRPGMGKFSKQRLEREKGNEERATPSQSPTPTATNSNLYKTTKSSSEVRSMTFKRSVSRDVS